MKISVAMIVLNEADNIKRAIESCDFADEVVVVDGGSIDGTTQIISALNVRPSIKIVRRQWENDFSKQRNVSFQHCMGDWILRLDADEIFSIRLRSTIRRFLEEIPEEALSIRIRQNNLVEDHDHYAANLGGWETHPRMFKNTGNLYWTGQVHEWVEGVSHLCVDWNVSILHFGWLDEEKLKQKEKAYMKMPGSGFYTPGSLTDRKYEVRKLPEGLY